LRIIQEESKNDTMKILLCRRRCLDRRTGCCMRGGV